MISPVFTVDFEFCLTQSEGPLDFIFRIKIILEIMIIKSDKKYLDCSITGCDDLMT